jgi:DtxR family Mn-dependent transcriptional regulator
MKAAFVSGAPLFVAGADGAVACVVLAEPDGVVAVVVVAPVVVVAAVTAGLVASVDAAVLLVADLLPQPASATASRTAMAPGFASGVRTWRTVAHDESLVCHNLVVVTEKRHSAAVEDYAKAIYSLSARGSGAVTNNALAERLDVTPGSASAMVKRLTELGLVSHVPYHGCALTPAGKRVALEVLRHHRLIELFLTEALSVPWDRVHDEAEVLEHVLSEELEELIAAKLGHPAHDPHGDPIPTRELMIDEGTSQALQALEAGERGVFVRVSDSDPAMLAYLAEREISLGMALEVLDKQPFGGPLSVRLGADVHVIGGRLAAAMRVEVER